MVGVQQWAEIRRLHFVEKRSKRAIHRLTGLHRDTITRAIESAVPPKYERRASAGRLGFGSRETADTSPSPGAGVGADR